jgi:hypothetical protein
MANRTTIFKRSEDTKKASYNKMRPCIYMRATMTILLLTGKKSLNKTGSITTVMTTDSTGILLLAGE